MTSPHPTDRKRLPPEQRRAQLLEHALAVFARRGLGRAGHAEIAREANVAVSTAFLYFPTRDALVGAVLDEVEAFYLGLAERIHARRAPAREVIAAHGRAFRESIETHPHHARVWLDWSTAFRDEIWPRYLAFNERLVANHERTIRRGQREGQIPSSLDPEASARLLIGSAQMVAQMKLSEFDPAKLERVARTVLAAALGEASSPLSNPALVAAQE